jgi:hypothetical protein
MRFTSAIDLVNKLEPAHLQSFWYFASKVNLAIIGTFGSLLWATSDNADEAEFYRSQLAEYRWTLRVSSKAAEFMKFTVGMLDASAVFLKDAASKTGTPTMVREPSHGESKAEHGADPGTESTPEHATHNFHDYSQAYLGASEVSPSVGNSTENAYPYEIEYTPSGTTLAPDIRPAWSGFAETVNFTPGDVQDWSLDQLYNFENIPGIEDVLGNRRVVQEYDETGNTFDGF